MEKCLEIIIGIVYLVILAIFGLQAIGTILVTIWPLFSSILPIGGLISAFFSWIISLATFPPYSKSPNREVASCNRSADYIFNPTDYKEIKLCDSHKSQVESCAQYGALFHPDVAQSVVSVY